MASNIVAAQVDPLSHPYEHCPDIASLLDRLEVPHHEYATWQTENNLVGWTRDRSQAHVCMFAGMRYSARAKSAMMIDVAREMQNGQQWPRAHEVAQLEALLHELEVPRDEYGELAAERKLSAMSREAHLSVVCLYAGLRHLAVDNAQVVVERARRSSAKEVKRRARAAVIAGKRAAKRQAATAARAFA